MKNLIKNRYANLYLNAAAKHNLKFRIINEKAALVKIFNNSKTLDLSANVLDINSQLSSALAINKKKTSLLLKEKNIPIPPFKTFKNEQKAERYLIDRISKYENFVVKPLKGSLAVGVTINPATPKQVSYAVKEAFNENSEIIVEKYIQGHHYRITVLENEVIAITQRIPAYIIGEKSKTIHKLINEKNLTRRKYSLPQIILRPKDYDYLKSKGIDTNSTYYTGEKLYLHPGCDYDIGGERNYIDVNSVPRINIQMFIKAVKALGLKFAGVDYISPDITTPHVNVISAINEINSAPDLDVHYRDRYPNNNYAAERIIEKIFKNEIIKQESIVLAEPSTITPLLHA